jgi:hypothetical protein
MRIFEVLDLSTLHLPPELRRDLTGVPGVITDKARYGWWLWVPDDVAETTAPSDDPLPVAIVYLQHLARQLGCDWILFDRDASVIAGLPVWPDPVKQAETQP